MIAAKNGLKPRRLPHFERPDLEMVWICLELSTPIYVCCIYLPERAMATPYTNFVKAMHDNVASIREMDYHLLVLGDFNLSPINWSVCGDGSLDPGDYSTQDLNDTNAEMMHLMSCFNLKQFNRVFNPRNRILDLALTDFSPANVSCDEHEIMKSEL